MQQQVGPSCLHKSTDRKFQQHLLKISPNHVNKYTYHIHSLNAFCLYLKVKLWIYMSNIFGMKWNIPLSHRPLFHDSRNWQSHQARLPCTATWDTAIFHTGEALMLQTCQLLLLSYCRLLNWGDKYKCRNNKLRTNTHPYTIPPPILPYVQKQKKKKEEVSL